MICTFCKSEIERPVIVTAGPSKGTYCSDRCEDLAFEEFFLDDAPCPDCLSYGCEQAGLPTGCGRAPKLSSMKQGLT